MYTRQYDSAGDVNRRCDSHLIQTTYPVRPSTWDSSGQFL